MYLEVPDNRETNCHIHRLGAALTLPHLHFPPELSQQAPTHSLIRALTHHTRSTDASTQQLPVHGLVCPLQALLSADPPSTLCLPRTALQMSPIMAFYDSLLLSAFVQPRDLLIGCAKDIDTSSTASTRAFPRPAWNYFAYSLTQIHAPWA